MWLWGIDPLRFTSPFMGWGMWGLSALALLPAVSRRLEPMATRISGSTRGAGWSMYVVWAAVAGLVVLLLPDRLLFVGDSLLRRDMLAAPPGGFRALNPQALLLDGWLHDALARRLVTGLGVGSEAVARALGVLEAMTMGALAVHLTRVLGLRGAAALAAAAVFLWSGALALFTGYAKSFSELALVTAAVGVFGLDAVRRGRAHLPLGIALAVGLFVHRLAIALVPAWAVVWLLWWLGTDPAARRLSVVHVLALAIPLGALGLAAPGLIRVIAGFDPVNFASSEGGRAGGMLAAALRPTRLADVANMILLMAPLAPLIALLPFVLQHPRRRREGVLLATLGLPLVGFLPFFHPPLGLFRNWDACAPTAVALSLAAAWCAAVLLSERPRGAWLGVAVALQAAAPGVHWLMHQHDVGRGLARVEAYLREPPPRTEIERASAWDFLGSRYVDLGRIDASADAFSAAAAITPSPRILREWATLETMRGDPDAARRVIRMLLARKPSEVRAWMELAQLAYQQGDTSEARHAANEALHLSPGLPPARGLLEHLDSFPDAPKH